MIQVFHLPIQKFLSILEARKKGKSAEISKLFDKKSVLFFKPIKFNLFKRNSNLKNETLSVTLYASFTSEEISENR